MRKFALPGLYPRERKWFTSVIFFTGFIVPVLLYLIWFLAIPTFLNYFDQIGMVNPGQNVISARYDAVSIISLGNWSIMDNYNWCFNDLDTVSLSFFWYGKQ